VFPVTATVILIWAIWSLTPQSTMLIILGGVLPVIWAPQLILAISIAKRLPRLVLDLKGFEVVWLFGVRGWHWSDIASFSAFPLFVRVRYSTPARNLWEKFNRDRWIIPCFGFGVRDLACLMTEWRERALGHAVHDIGPA